MSEWISVKDRLPPQDEPVVYMRFYARGKAHVGIAYWCVSDRFVPEAQSIHAPDGFSHWMPLPPPPEQESE